jgi:CcmD family protein
MDGFLIAYLVVWMAVVVYVGRMGAEQRRLSRALKTLRLQVEELKEPAPSVNKAA